MLRDANEEWKMIGKYQGAVELINDLTLRGVDKLLLAAALEEFKERNPLGTEQ